ncbi:MULTISPECIES: hypothetical protein [Nitrospirillum]|uniref:Uncharacterized protein n=1 Tax=Nitrospirillum amazonense TaxID=28077 RepID=A0A560FL12_9PROT|nr:hypothetical protein [Nitrospirillum amazonense]MEC4590916.1 hypothetical protein [Nitrospirillum amazonense]TWB22297.1 hypothetical protein FBZ88_116128 [Nitrospirillum amazonense]
MAAAEGPGQWGDRWIGTQRIAAALLALVDALHPWRIYLLVPSPMRAEGAAGHFLIVIDDEAPLPCWDGNLALATLGRLDLPAAVTVLCMGDFRSALQVDGSIAQRMVEEGELLFAARSPWKDGEVRLKA